MSSWMLPITTCDKVTRPKLKSGGKLCVVCIFVEFLHIFIFQRIELSKAVS